jgi:hypothetical protein
MLKNEKIANWLGREKKKEQKRKWTRDGNIYAAHSINIQLLSRICRRGLKVVIWKNVVDTQVNRGEADHALELAPYLPTSDPRLKTPKAETMAKKEWFSNILHMYINNKTTQHSRCYNVQICSSNYHIINKITHLSKLKN